MSNPMSRSYYFLISLVTIVHTGPLLSAREVNESTYSSFASRTHNYETAPGVNYEYICIKADSNPASKPTLLFLHGFPSSFHSWRYQIEYFARQKYNIIAPNMMGYGKTYSPVDKDEYKGKIMVEHLTILLDRLHVGKVVVIGHDWGTRAANRFALHHPERTLGVVLISAGYTPPAIFDLDRALEASRNASGYETIGYWKFFDADDAAAIIGSNLDSFIDLVFPSDPVLWRTNFSPAGKAREWFTNGTRTARAPYMTEEDYATVRQYLADGMQPKLNWFKAVIANIDWDDEKDLDPVINRPVLLLGGTRDYSSRIASYGGPNRYIPTLETVALDTGHWVMEEDPSAVNRQLHSWLKKLLLDKNI